MRTWSAGLIWPDAPGTPGSETRLWARGKGSVSPSVVDAGPDQVDIRAELPEQDRLGDLGALGDLLDAGPAEAAFGEKFVRSLEQMIMDALADRHAGTRCGRRGDRFPVQPSHRCPSAPLGTAA